MMHAVVSTVARLVKQTNNINDSLPCTFCIIDASHILQAKFMMFIISTKCHTECEAIQEMYVSTKYDTGCRYGMFMMYSCLYCISIRCHTICRLCV